MHIDEAGQLFTKIEPNMKPDIEYRALLADKRDDSMELKVKTMRTSSLPDHNVLIRVYYSSLNYKDALSASGNTGITKSYPHTPGIDAAGIVEWSTDSRFDEGDSVVVTGYDLGQNTPGGFGEYISVPADWVVPLPENLSLKESMILGTAGFTAAYGVKLMMDKGIKTGDGEVLVTGATGGVGTLAVVILSRIGFQVTAVTGKPDIASFLTSLGATNVVSRESVTDVKGSPLLSSRWQAAIDTVGGEMLDAVIRQTAHNGVVACCGNILGGKLTTSIYPFILRGVALMGIDSGNCLMAHRQQIWSLLANNWNPKIPDALWKERHISELPPIIDAMLNGKIRGRMLVTLRD